MSVTDLATRHPGKSLALIAALTFALITWTVLSVFDRSLREELQAGTESLHSAFTRVFVNDHWDALRPLLDLEGRLSNPRANAGLREIDQRVRGFAKGTDLVAVRILNAAGVVHYSSEPAEVGRSLAADAGFLAASRGRVSSELVQKATFKGFDGELRDRSLVESYVPVRGAAGVEAVVEMYTDRTASVIALERQRSALLRWMLPTLGLGFAIVLLFSAWLNRALERREALARADAQESLMMSEATAHAAEARLDELNTLLAQIDAPARRLQAQRPAGDLADALSDLLRQTQRVALWRALQGGRAATARRSLPVPEGVNAAVQAISAGTAARGLKWALHIDDTARARHFVEADAVLEVLTLLMEATLESTPAGTLQVKVQAVPAGLAIDLISASADSTDGRQAAEKLHMAEALAALLGGRLDVKFTPGRGSWFNLVLPTSSLK